MWVLELNPGPLQEQQGILTTESSLHPVNHCLLFVEAGSHYVTLASLALNSIDQADLVLTENPPASASPVLTSKACVTMLGSSFYYYSLNTIRDEKMSKILQILRDVFSCPPKTSPFLQGTITGEKKQFCF